MNEKQIAILFGLRQRRDAMRQIYGEKWPQVWAEYAGFIRHRMEVDGLDILPAALTLAKVLEDGGHSPNALLASAVEMIEEASK